MRLEISALSHPLSPADRIGPDSDLAGYFIRSGKPACRWMVGPELELFGFTRSALRRIDADQVQSVIEGFSSSIIERESENGYVTEARLSIGGGARITLEPGGQIEFSGAPETSLLEVERAMIDYAAKLRAVADERGFVFVAVGFDPVRGLREQNWIPKKRYRIMRPYLAARGRRAEDMMARTAAIQVSLDYDSAQDLAKKFALANRLGPVAAAIFANSPFEEGRLSGYKSTRYGVWLETDPDRTGPSPVALEDDFSITRFIDYVASVPMFFIRRNGSYVDLSGRSFAEFIAGCAPGEAPVFQDFTDHLTTLFTEARLKPHIEQRSMDCGSTDMLMAALAFWKGLMYDSLSLESALRMLPRLSKSEFLELQLEVARRGLEARLGKLSVIDLARSAVELARRGLKAQAPDETRYLDPIEQQVARERICPADILIKNFNGSWNGDIRKAIDYLQITSA